MLTTGLALTMARAAWLHRLDLHTPCLTGVVSPMVLIGVDQGRSTPSRGGSATTSTPSGPAPRPDDSPGPPLLLGRHDRRRPCR